LKFKRGDAPDVSKQKVVLQWNNQNYKVIHANIYKNKRWSFILISYKIMLFINHSISNVNLLLTHFHDILVPFMIHFTNCLFWLIYLAYKMLLRIVKPKPNIPLISFFFLYLLIYLIFNLISLFFCFLILLPKPNTLYFIWRLFHMIKWFPRYNSNFIFNI